MARILLIVVIYFDFGPHFSLGENTGLQNTNRNVDIVAEEEDIAPETLSGNYSILRNCQIRKQGFSS